MRGTAIGSVLHNGDMIRASKDGKSWYKSEYNSLASLGGVKWIRWSTLVLVLITWTMAASLGVSHAGLAAWLALCGASGAFRVLWFKPALDRAAFPEPH